MDCCEEPVYDGFVYVLDLADDCTYVGYTGDPEVRISSHFLGRGAGWTRAHAPVGIRSIQRGDERLENCLTLALMAKHGWRKVRGGRWLDVNMTAPPPPIRKAFAIRPPTRLREAWTEVVNGHTYSVQQTGDEGRWRARITGARSARECPKTAVKTLYGESSEDLKRRVEAWVEGGDERAESRGDGAAAVGEGGDERLRRYCVGDGLFRVPMGEGGCTVANGEAAGGEEELQWCSPRSFPEVATNKTLS